MIDKLRRNIGVAVTSLALVGSLVAPAIPGVAEEHPEETSATTTATTAAATKATTSTTSTTAPTTTTTRFFETWRPQDSTAAAVAASWSATGTLPPGAVAFTCYMLDYGALLGDAATTASLWHVGYGEGPQNVWGALCSAPTDHGEQPLLYPASSSFARTDGQYVELSIPWVPSAICVVYELTPTGGWVRWGCAHYSYIECGHPPQTWMGEGVCWVQRSGDVRPQWERPFDWVGSQRGLLDQFSSTVAISTSTDAQGRVWVEEVTSTRKPNVVLQSGDLWSNVAEWPGGASHGPPFIRPYAPDPVAYVAPTTVVTSVSRTCTITAASTARCPAAPAPPPPPQDRRG